MVPLTRRPGCSACGIGPASPRAAPQTPPVEPQSSPLPMRLQASFGVLFALLAGLAVIVIIIVGAETEHSPPSEIPSSSQVASNTPPATEESSTPTASTDTTPPPAAEPSPSTSESPATTAPTETPAPSCSTPAQCAEEGADAAAGEDANAESSETQSEPTATQASATPNPSEQAPEPGTSEATAQIIEPGVEEEGNSGTADYGEGSCGQEEGQFWQASLQEGDRVTIVWGGPNNSAMGLDIWPPGTTGISGSDERRVAYGSAQAEYSKTTFTAPTTGVYPIVIDDSCGQPGVFHFTLTVQSS